MLKAVRLSIIVIIVCLISTVAINRASFAEYKFGYVDINKIFNNYKKTIEADKSLEAEQKQKQKERKDLVSEIRKLKDSLDLLSDEAKKSKQKQIDEKIKSLQDFDRKTRDELLKKRDDAAKQIIKELDALIKEIGKKEGYTFIFNGRFILYSTKDYDLTDKVLKILNKRAK